MLGICRFCLCLDDSKLIVCQPTHRLEKQLGGLCLSVEAHLRHDCLGVDRRVLHCQIPSVCLQGALITIFLAEDRQGWQRQLQNVTTNIVGSHNSKALLITASTAVACARASDVLFTLHAGVALLVLSCRIRHVTSVAPAIRGCGILSIVRSSVKNTADLGGCSDDDDIEKAIINGSHFLATGHQAEHAALDGNALGVVGTADECLGSCGEFCIADVRRDVCGTEKGNVAHLVSFLVRRFTN